ncbi:MAG: Ppx/GppA phosphatase family protein [Myxococcota bacterium]
MGRAPLACVDLGTNTCLMLVARPDDDGGVEVLADRARIIRLGEGVDRTRRLAESAKQRALTCLGEYAQEARSLGATHLVAVATSAMRDAEDGREFAREIEAQTGFHVDIISGDEEAGLAYAAVAADFAQAGKKTAVFDIGGGSTEVMIGEGNSLLSRVSVDIGSVRLTERFLKHDPPTVDELAALQAHINSALERRPPLEPGTPLVGIAGTVTTLAACALGQDTYDAAQVHGAPLSIQSVEGLRRRFAELTSAGRLAIKPLEPGRADVIVAGAMIVESIMRAYGVPRIVVGDRGVRFGLCYREVARLR